ncbi:hypothetical protein [Nocardia asteroides]|uniref:hypothetical protein n=1 Tax=Nocardia asteroides TaxID=1824 RepID=UPI0033F5330B
MTEPNPLQQPDPAPPADPTPVVPSPADMPATVPGGEQPRQVKTDWSPEDATKVIAELREENKSWRKKYGEAEPIIKAHEEAQEAAKTAEQRANERAAAAEKLATEREQELNVLRAAGKHGIPLEDHDLLGSGTPEELDARAARLAARYSASAPTPPPPSDRPVEGLRPGASPTPPAPADTSYPAAWAPRGRQS